MKEVINGCSRPGLRATHVRMVARRPSSNAGGEPIPTFVGEVSRLLELRKMLQEEVLQVRLLKKLDEHFIFVTVRVTVAGIVEEGTTKRPGSVRQLAAEKDI